MTPTPARTSPHGEPDQRETASRDRHASRRITCGGCDHTWTGVHRAHCSVCHETFNSPSGFDHHRRGGDCTDPAELGMTSTDDGIWRENGHGFDPDRAFHPGGQE